MQLALECRTDMLEMVQPFADFDWILTHKVLEDEAYAEYYKNSTNIKFVDNSVEELREPLTLDQMKEAFELVGGSYLISPDWIDDADKTLASYKECMGKLPKEKVIGVVHGPTFTDAFRCIEAYGGNIIVVPYDICSKPDDPPWLMALRRALIVSNIPAIEGRYIHLLGFTSLDEFFWYQNNPRVVSIDTGIPVLLGLQALDILDPLESKSKPTFVQGEKIELDQKGWTAICRNIALLRKYLP